MSRICSDLWIHNNKKRSDIQKTGTHDIPTRGEKMLIKLVTSKIPTIVYIILIFCRNKLYFERGTTKFAFPFFCCSKSEMESTLGKCRSMLGNGGCCWKKRRHFLSWLFMLMLAWSIILLFVNLLLHGDVPY